MQKNVLNFVGGLNNGMSMQTYVFKDKNTGKDKYADVHMGDLYQATKQKVEHLHQNGFIVVEMWEHDWVCYCKKQK